MNKKPKVGDRVFLKKETRNGRQRTLATTTLVQEVRNEELPYTWHHIDGQAFTITDIYKNDKTTEYVGIWESASGWTFKCYGKLKCFQVIKDEELLTSIDELDQDMKELVEMGF